MSRPSAKKEDPKDAITTGIKGAVKRTIVESMVKAVPGSFKVVVADNAGSQILNACMRMHDLMDGGVSLVEKLEMARQPLPPSAAIYFISPTVENVQRVCADWETKDMYKEAHIYFISESTNQLFQIIKSSRLGRSGKIKNCVDLLISFNAPETLFFSLDGGGSDGGASTAAAAAAPAATSASASSDLKYFFSPAGANSDLGAAYQRRAAKTLAQVMHTLGDDPVIRHQNSLTAKRFSEAFYAEYKTLMSTVADGGRGGAAAKGKPALLLIVDRTVDMAAPILHDYHYQTQVLECAPLKNGNVYEYRPPGTDKDGGASKPRECVLDELDPYWCRYRHLHYAHASSLNADDHNALFDKQEAMSKQKKSGDASVSVHQLSAQIRQLPEMLEQQRKIGLHRDLVVLLDPFYSYEIACAERLILEAIADKKGAEYREALKKVCAVKNSPTGKVMGQPRDMLRLALLLALAFPKDFGADGGAGALQALALQSDASAAIRGLQLLMTTAASDVSARTFGQVKQSLFKTLPEKLRNPPPVYQYNLKGLMEQCVAGTLPPATFPFLKAGDEAKLNPSNFTSSSSGAGASGGGSSIVTKSLRAKLTGSSSPSEKGGGQLSGRSIDLGHGEAVPLTTGPRVVVFVIGGATRGEMRAAYETTRGKKREVILGATSVTSAVGYISQLQQL